MIFQSFFLAIISGLSKIYSLFDWLRKISLGIEVDEPFLYLRLTGVCIIDANPPKYMLF